MEAGSISGFRRPRGQPKGIFVIQGTVQRRWPCLGLVFAAFAPSCGLLIGILLPCLTTTAQAQSTHATNEDGTITIAKYIGGTDFTDEEAARPGL
jgi:hypothetical protein